ncbi:hypothetical protein CEXT_72711 [Caerostris extrusa]|uniref:Uncharacterized protein n=1 Tax=Caerostris extrusa TaxID=172846 RepID=A0AAV4W674_CAEEX|nr:hypothetical protein CEXT_72711 [Caerostris extrusa]
MNALSLENECFYVELNVMHSKEVKGKSNGKIAFRYSNCYCTNDEILFMQSSHSFGQKEGKIPAWLKKWKLVCDLERDGAPFHNIKSRTFANISCSQFVPVRLFQLKNLPICDMFV